MKYSKKNKKNTKKKQIIYKLIYILFSTTCVPLHIIISFFYVQGKNSTITQN
nr:MAG TPA: hypothetical protein [Caudoviricetes sp.]